MYMYVNKRVELAQRGIALQKIYLLLLLHTHTHARTHARTHPPTHPHTHTHTLAPKDVCARDTVQQLPPV